MLAFFPSMYKDELLYSVLARYHKRSGNLTNKDSALDLFGKKKAYIIPDLTTDLEKIYEKVNPFLSSSIDEWINYHTLYHYYTNFTSKEIKQSVRDTMLKGCGNNSLHYSTGQVAWTVKEPMYFRYCPNCYEEDIEMNGETYWRTYHQLPSVFICTKHSVFLENSSLLIRPGNSSYFYPSIENNLNNVEKIDYSKVNFDLLRHFAVESSKLNQNDYKFDQLNLLEIYHYLLHREGYVKTNGTIDQRRLKEVFIQKFKTELLSLMQSIPSGVDGSCWLRAITRKHRKSFHPVRHLLLIYFLGESVDTIKQYANKYYTPFGEGPHLCLNPAAKHYLQPVIIDLKISRCNVSKRPIGTFSCVCGFVYSRKGPDKTEDDKTKIGRIKMFGETWLNKLHQLVEIEQVSYKTCSKILKVDTKTIIKYSRQKNSKPISKKNTDLKQMWLDLINQYPTFSRTELRKKDPSLYMRIYRHDKEWLKKHPSFVKTNVDTNNKVDWTKRDLQILAKVKVAIEDLNTREKPVRLTTSSIGKAINQLTLLEKKAHKLPRTMAYIDSVKESVRNFQKRRIDWSVKQLKDEELEFWKIVRKAGIRESFYPDLAEEIMTHIIKHE